MAIRLCVSLFDRIERLHLPDPYRIDAEHMLASMKPARREARRLANYLLSPEGQGFLVNKGFVSLF
ncbi:substrate-binding domain-containing protein [Pectobacterium araliae]|uniref:substrate-binding domain-containing protein n=1 Tax=Pectobacterium araliae TaxID=3073862 RepID=UPI003CE4CFCC